MPDNIDAGLPGKVGLEGNGARIIDFQAERQTRRADIIAGEVDASLGAIPGIDTNPPAQRRFIEEFAHGSFDGVAEKAAADAAAEIPEPAADVAPEAPEGVHAVAAEQVTVEAPADGAVQPKAPDGDPEKPADAPEAPEPEAEPAAKAAEDDESSTEDDEQNEKPVEEMSDDERRDATQKALEKYLDSDDEAEQDELIDRINKLRGRDTAESPIVNSEVAAAMIDKLNEGIDPTDRAAYERVMKKLTELFGELHAIDVWFRSLPDTADDMEKQKKDLKKEYNRTESEYLTEKDKTKQKAKLIEMQQISGQIKYIEFQAKVSKDNIRNQWKAKREILSQLDDILATKSTLHKLALGVGRSMGSLHVEGYINRMRDVENA